MVSDRPITDSILMNEIKITDQKVRTKILLKLNEGTFFIYIIFFYIAIKFL
jgi:hypothetical protein